MTKAQILAGDTKTIGNGLEPSFDSTYSSNTKSVTINITNFSWDYTWKSSVSVGTSEIQGEGRVVISDFESNKPITLTVTSSRKNYLDSTKSLTFSPKVRLQSPMVVQALVKSVNKGCEFEISNLDIVSKLVVESDAGQVTELSKGKFTILELNQNEIARVKISNIGENYLPSGFTYINCEPLPIYENLTQRDWKLIAKDPEGNKNRYIKIFGKITQFDAATGTSQFRADIAGTLEEIVGAYFYGDNTFLTGTSQSLKDFVAGDKFQADVRVTGAYTYTTTLNGQMSVPMLAIFAIKRVG